MGTLKYDLIYAARALLLRTLPYQQLARVVVVWEAPAGYLDWKVLGSTVGARYLRQTVYDVHPQLPLGSMSFVIRTTRPPSSLMNPVIASIHAVDKEQLVGAMQPMNNVLGEFIPGTQPTQDIGPNWIAARSPVASLLTAVALAATVIPVFRATKVDHMVALRYE